MRILKNKMFFKWAKSQRLNNNDLLTATKEIEQGLFDANLGGNIIKKRIAKKGKGKRSGFRTVVAFQKNNRAIYVYGFQKNQKDNITDQEEIALKKLANSLLNASEIKINEMIAKKDLYEVNHEEAKKQKASRHTRNRS